MEQVITQLITSVLGSLGFAIIFNIRKKYMPSAALGGLVCWAAYLIAFEISSGVFVSSFFASLFATLYAEISARIMKVPATVIFVSAIIPLIPGSSLFYTVFYAVYTNYDLFVKYGLSTIKVILGITVGISTVWSLWYMVNTIVSNKKRKSVD